MKRAYHKGPPAERFQKRLTATAGGCLEYQGHRIVKGYGWFGVTPGKSVLAHRFAWEQANGPIPDGLCVLHSCDNPPCCNPAHLFLGTRVDNNADMRAKGRARIVHYKGEQANNAKLTEAQVLAIRASYRPRIVTQQMLADEYGVCEATVSHILTGRNWSHL